jgi:hypothetical protein
MDLPPGRAGAHPYHATRVTTPDARERIPTTPTRRHAERLLREPSVELRYHP